MLITTKQIKAAFGKKAQTQLFKPLFDGAKQIELTPELLAPVLLQMNEYDGATSMIRYSYLAHAFNATGTQMATLEAAIKHFQDNYWPLLDAGKSFNKAERQANRDAYDAYYLEWIELSNKSILIARMIRNLEVDCAKADFEMTALYAPATNRHLMFFNLNNRTDYAENLFLFNSDVADDAVKATTINSPAGQALNAEYEKMLDAAENQAWENTLPLRDTLRDTLISMFFEIITGQML